MRAGTLPDDAGRRALGRDEHVAADVIARRAPLPNGPLASFSLHDVKQRAFLRSRSAVLRAGSRFLCILVHPLGHPTPRMRGPAERREAYYLSCRARRARRHACEAWGVPRKTGTPPLGAPPWRCRPRNRSGRANSCDPASRLLTASHCHGGLRHRASRSRLYGPLSTPLPAPPAGSSPETPLTSEDGKYILHLHIVVNR